MPDSLTLAAEQCYHCGLDLPSAPVVFNGRKFCCSGCGNVYQVLAENDLCSYYRYTDAPGQAQTGDPSRFGYLDEPEVIRRLADYIGEEAIVVTFYIPAIHCTSCIWLLEHLYKLDAAVAQSRIDFLKKELTVTFRTPDTSLRNIAELLARIGYEPLISAQTADSKKKDETAPDLVRRIAVAGFCMGNVMLFSFPEYLGLAKTDALRPLFGWLNLALSLPVVFYSAKVFFVSAWAGLKTRLINLDAPLALIIAVLFLRSAFEVVTRTGPGFFDTLTGLTFLLLMGRWVKHRAYRHISFQRDYRSYFPMAVTVLSDDAEHTAMTDALKPGDRILVRNNEIIPADAVLLKGRAYIDFSFVTGESALNFRSPGELIYAGGKQQGEALELEVQKPVAQSYLTSLWNNEVFGFKSPIRTFNNTVARYFGAAALVIAVAAAAFWLARHDEAKAWASFTAVLIVVCPCVLALSSPYILSAVLAVFDRKGFHLRDTDVVEQLARTDTIVFDKTGTLTAPDRFDMSFDGYLSWSDKVTLASLARNSNHPLSRELVRWLGVTSYDDTAHYVETAGQGISGTVRGVNVVIGSAAMLGIAPGATIEPCFYVQTDGVVLGKFTYRVNYRRSMTRLLNELRHHFSLHLLSGDSQQERRRLAEWFSWDNMRFLQSPQNKLDYVLTEQHRGHSVVMIGDGLNDAGALRQSDVGIAVTDNVNNFSPACDAVLEGDALELLPRFFRLAHAAARTIRWSFVIAASYNLVGLWFAVQGILSPLTAAVLMPLSTSTILSFSTLATRYHVRKTQLS